MDALKVEVAMVGIALNRLLRAALSLILATGLLAAWAGADQAFAFKVDPVWAAKRAAEEAVIRSAANEAAGGPWRRLARVVVAYPPGPHARPTLTRAVVDAKLVQDTKQVQGIRITPASVSWKMNGLKPELVVLLAHVQMHFGRPLHIVSGCRSRRHNKRVGGARRSQHLLCSAVDFEMDGVPKYKLANYLKQLPGRGGVGVYCRSSFVHLDIGPRRHWHWKCRKRRRSAKRRTSHKHAGLKQKSTQRRALRKLSGGGKDQIAQRDR